MRRLLFGSLVLFLTAAAEAQSVVPKHAFSVFVTDVDYTSSSTQHRLEGGIGVAFRKAISRNLSAELSVIAESHRSWRPEQASTGVRYTPIDVTTWPIDLSVDYHFRTAGRWQPYAGAGLHYIHYSAYAGAVCTATGCLGGYKYNRTTLYPQIEGGVVFKFRENLGWFVAAKQVLGNATSDSNLDAPFRPSTGFVWRW